MRTSDWPKLLTKVLNVVLTVLIIGAVNFPLRAMAAPDAPCNETELRDLGVAVLNCTGDSSPDSSCSTDGVTIEAGSDNSLAVWNFFRSQGLSPAQAAGFMGNMVEEAHFEPRLVEYGYKNSRGEVSAPGKPSSFDDNVPPDQKSNGQPGYGLIQWTSPGRKNGLRQKAANDPQKRPAGTLSLQLEYMWSELNGPYKNSTLTPVLAAPTVDASTAIVTRNYEIPGGSIPGHIVTRTKAARGFLVKYGSLPAPASTTTTAPVATPSSSTTDSCLSGGAAVSANLAGAVNLALLYSWPDKSHGLTPKPEYAAAIQKFNPNAPYNGADCGAFIGTVMHASGADPSYPLSGTSAQMAYVTSHPQKYDVTTNFTIADLLPGDILIVTAGGSSDFGHTYMFVGNQGGGKNKADASIGSRMPTIGVAEVVDSSGRGHYTRARLK